MKFKMKKGKSELGTTVKLKRAVTLQGSPLLFIIRKQSIGSMMLGLLVLGSAIGVVYSKHLNRNLHIQLQQLQELRGKLHVEWTQLLLEEGTLGSDVRVEEIAKEQLGMIVVPQNKIVVIKP